jgi:hypothetical protein
MPGEKARFSEKNLAQTIMANAPRRSGAGILEYVTLLEIQSECEKTYNIIFPQLPVPISMRIGS